MDWKTYEETTKNIYETLGQKLSVKIVGYGNNFKIKGKSKVDHQIDVLTSHSVGIHEYLTAIECKYWNKNIDKDIVMKIAEIVEDCNFTKGVIVTKKGFTADCITFAEYKNIGLVILREPIGEELKTRIKYFIITANNHVANVTKFESQNIEVYKNIFNQMIQTDRYFYLFNDGTKKSMQHYLDDFRRKLLKK